MIFIDNINCSANTICMKNINLSKLCPDEKSAIKLFAARVNMGQVQTIANYCYDFESIEKHDQENSSYFLKDDINIIANSIARHSYNEAPNFMYLVSMYDDIIRPYINIIYKTSLTPGPENWAHYKTCFRVLTGHVCSELMCADLMLSFDKSTMDFNKRYFYKIIRDSTQYYLENNKSYYMPDFLTNTLTFCPDDYKENIYKLISKGINDKGIKQQFKKIINKTKVDINEYTDRYMGVCESLLARFLNMKDLSYLVKNSSGTNIVFVSALQKRLEMEQNSELKDVLQKWVNCQIKKFKNYYIPNRTEGFIYRNKILQTRKNLIERLKDEHLNNIFKYNPGILR